MATTTIVSGVQYSGIWNISSQANAKAAGTWPEGSPQALYAWGGGYSGRLGLGNTTNYSSPKQIGALTNWLNISGGGYSTTAVKKDGTLWSWGYNLYGMLGLGNTTAYSSPKQVGALTNWSSTSNGKYQ